MISTEKPAEAVASKRCNLAAANILIAGPSAPGSAIRRLSAFVQHHRREKSACLVFAAHPIPNYSVVKESEFLWVTGSGAHHSGKLRRGSIPIVSHFLDMVLTLLLVARIRRRYDTYIGGGLHLIFLGIVLKRMRLVKYTVGFAMEYWPKRFGNRLLDWLYRGLDGYCFSHLDYVLNTTSAVAEARVRRGAKVDPERQISVPHMIEANEMGLLPPSQVETDSLVWTGNVTTEYGFELVLDAMPLVLQKRPKAVVDMTSYGKYPNGLRQKIVDRGLEKHFRLSGFIEDAAEFRNFLRKHRAGLAPYRPDESSQKNYGGVSRPIEYMANGVPPIITRVPPIAADIERTGAGVTIDYDKTQLANAILALLSDDELYRQCQRRGLEFVKKRSEANSVCREVFTRLGLIPDAEPVDE